MSKGIVMENTLNHIVIMTAEGQFMKLSRKKYSHSCEVGEEIYFTVHDVH